jgi:uncharacterized protein
MENQDRDRLRELAETLVVAVANDKDEVQVTASARGEELTLHIRVATDDMGRVIGKKGRIASALRTVLRAAAGGDADINVEIDDK